MPIVHRSTSANRTRVIVSLCDYSGAWCRPYIEAGYTVIQLDMKHGDDVTDYEGTMGGILSVLAETAGTLNPSRVVGVLAAPPCTDFTVSGAQYWPAKDAGGRTAQSLAVVQGCLRIIASCNPDWWALENPVGRLPKLLPAIGKPWYFHPCDYAGWLVGEAAERDRYTKRTGIWGTASRPPTKPLEPIRVCAQGSWVQMLGGKSERTKTLRSMTPEGFARAFALANR
jgi:hypothetical protein